jgi:hypothetical protein
MSQDDDDNVYDDVPLNHKKAFGSSLKIKRVDFVKGSDGDLASTHTTDGPCGQTVSDLYLGVVLKNQGDSPPPNSRGNATPATRSASPSSSPEPSQAICRDCNLPLDDPTDPSTADGAAAAKHDASMAHQVRLPHSHPPSSINRSRMGLAVLSSRGWDPDARRGLGAEEQGITHPIRAKPKDDNLGVGLEVPKDVLEKAKKPCEQKLKESKGVKRMKLREKLRADKKRDQKLHDLFYGNDDVVKYLGKR